MLVLYFVNKTTSYFINVLMLRLNLFIKLVDLLRATNMLTHSTVHYTS